MEKVEVAGLGVAGFMAVTWRVCWVWVYGVAPWLYPVLGTNGTNKTTLYRTFYNTDHLKGDLERITDLILCLSDGISSK